MHVLFFADGKLKKSSFTFISMLCGKMNDHVEGIVHKSSAS